MLKFDKRITIQEKTTTYDEIGNPISSWVDLFLVWTMIKTLKGQEYFDAGSSQSASTYRFVIRYRDGINGDMRIKYKGRTFDIIEPPINDDELNKTITIIARESNANG